MSSKKKRKRRPGQPRRGTPLSRGAASSAGGEPELVIEVRRALRSDHPFELITLVSSMLAAVDPRGADPFDRGGSSSDGVSLDDLISTFVQIREVEASALLIALHAMVDDPEVRTAIASELATRQDSVPAWLRLLEPLEVVEAMETVEVLGDGDNVMLDVRFPSGDAMTVVVLVDHNLGSVAKDGFVVPAALDEVVVSFRKASNDDPDIDFRPLALADARTRLTEAIEHGARVYPPLESETWPGARAIVEWVMRSLPPGGRGYQRPDWSEQDVAALAQRFLASGYGRNLDAVDADMLDSILWFATDYGPGDPMRWSPVSVEILLLDWLPRKIVAPEAHLARAPRVLRAFIGFCHDERDVPARLTELTLLAVDAFESEYLEMIASDRPQGVAALLERMGVDSGIDLDELRRVEASTDRWIRQGLEAAVGGEEALSLLDAQPLPEEPLDLSPVPEDVHERVRAIAALTDRCCQELLTVEHGTACRRLLVDIAAADPQIFRRRGKDETAAAAVAWIIGKANDVFRPYTGGLTAGGLTAWFGVHGSVSQRATTMLRALGLTRWTSYEPSLGSPTYLTSERRATLIKRRDELVDF